LHSSTCQPLAWKSDHDPEDVAEALDVILEDGLPDVTFV
jgi:hypothetical protein